MALRVLPEGFARDADRMGRFEREAQVLASLTATPIKLGATVQAGTPKPLFDTRMTGRRGTAQPRYAVAPDGRFLVMSIAESDARP